MINETDFQNRYVSGMQPVMTTPPARGTMRGGRQYRAAMQSEPQATDQNLSAAISAILDALKEEMGIRHFFGYLLYMAPSEEDMRFIMGMRENAMKHLQMFQLLYSELTGIYPLVITAAPYEQPLSYCDGLSYAHLRLQEDVALFREILFQMPQRRHINTITMIITDLLRHIGILNYLHAKAGCKI